MTKFFEHMWSSTIATFANKKEAHRLCRIDDLMFFVASDWRGKTPTVESVVPLMMFFRAHSAFRAACSIGMAGMPVEGMAMLRLCLEFAGYACLLKENPTLAQTWWDRDLDEKTLKKARNEFTGTAVIKGVKKVNGRLGKVYESLYDRTIKFGGHPNEKSITQSLALNWASEQMIIEQAYLQGDGPTLDHWIRTANQIGICVLHIFDHVHRERFEALNVRPRIAVLAKVL